MKLLPLTITLTVLLWLYADAHLTATQRDLPVKIAFAADLGNHNMTVHLISPQRGAYQIDIAGRKSRVSEVADQFYGRVILTARDRQDLTYAFNGAHFRYGKIYRFKTLALLNSLPYFKKQRVVVVSARPDVTKLEFNRLLRVRRPIVFSAFPGVKAQITPATAVVTIPGSVLNRIGGADELIVRAEPLQDVTGLVPGSHQTIEAQLVADYPGRVAQGVTIKPTTAEVSFTVPRSAVQVMHLGAVPIWIDGPAWILNRYKASVRPASVELTVIGSPKSLAHLERNIALGSLAPINRRIIGFVSLTASARATDGWIKHSVHYSLPKGVSILKGPQTVGLEVTRRPRGAIPAASSAPAIEKAKP